MANLNLIVHKFFCVRSTMDLLCLGLLTDIPFVRVTTAVNDESQAKNTLFASPSHLRRRRRDSLSSAPLTSWDTLGALSLSGTQKNRRRRGPRQKRGLFALSPRLDGSEQERKEKEGRKEGGVGTKIDRAVKEWEKERVRGPPPPPPHILTYSSTENLHGWPAWQEIVT